MFFDPPLETAYFVSRPNRFIARVRVREREAIAHLANPGRMAELLIPGAEMRVRPARSDRKTSYDACLIRLGRVWVGLESHRANDLVAEAIARRAIPALAAYSVSTREAAFGRGRADFLLADRDGATSFLEVKSCTLVEKRRGLFPDAPTVRGARHCREAAEHVRRGGRAAILFCVQRPDCDVVSPNRRTDPDFGRALDEASDAGVLLAAARCRVGPRSMLIDRAIRVAL